MLDIRQLSKSFGSGPTAVTALHEVSFGIREGEFFIRAVAMPADTNASGDIFGGWLMSQMDLAAGSVATLTSGGRSATIAVDAMIFHRPVKVGDEVSLYATLVRLGRTSMTIHVDAWRRPRARTQSEKVTEANFTFVALDSDGRPVPVRPVNADPSRP